MTTKNALVIKDAYLHSEVATGLEDMIVQAYEDTVDITVRGRDFVISLDAADVAAMYALVTKRPNQYYFNPAPQPASGLLVNSTPTSNLTKGILELLKEEPVRIWQKTWQLDWSKIPAEFKFVTKDKNLEGAWGWRTRPSKEAKGFWHSGLGFKLFGIVIPDDIDWEILHERPTEFEPTEPIPWHLDWTGINWQVKFICKDENEKAWGYPARPQLGTSMWNFPGGGWRMIGLDGQIPGNWREVLIERPE